AQDVQAEVAPGFGPFVVLFGQHGPDEADQGVAVWEDAHDVGPAADFPIEPFLYPALGGASTPGGRFGQRSRRCRWSVNASATRWWRAASSSQPRARASAS